MNGESASAQENRLLHAYRDTTTQIPYPRLSPVSVRAVFAGVIPFLSPMLCLSSHYDCFEISFSCDDPRTYLPAPLPLFWTCSFQLSSFRPTLIAKSLPFALPLATPPLSGTGLSLATCNCPWAVSVFPCCRAYSLPLCVNAAVRLYRAVLNQHTQSNLPSCDAHEARWSVTKDARLHARSLPAAAAVVTDGSKGCRASP